eukprot:TRINITY_DN31367_c0_g1_i1.p1 TRINITY_DN31367_c0_g1~~TRINITY_DN31367_c0_g1_i1.p1  ORF type:complete len:177 (+),score=16.78 TRINITY_DN31367_c0_g1_i1:22-531(+)
MSAPTEPKQSPHEVKCDYVAKNLLNMFSHAPDGTPSSVFVRELLKETARCDDHHKGRLSLVRSSYESYLKKEEHQPGTVERIKSLRTTEDDEKLCGVTVRHYDSWTQDQLKKCLGPWDKLQYYTFERAENTFAFVGIVLSGRYLIRGARRLSTASWEVIKKNTKPPASN